MSCRNIFRGCRACVFCIAAEDWGPATKFIGAIQDELAAGRENTLIMVVDDDRLYPRDALETYLYYSEQLPNAALCFRGAAMPSTLDWDDAKMIYGEGPSRAAPRSRYHRVRKLLVQPRFFDQSLWDYSGAPSVAFYIDDIWISAWLSRRGVKRYVIPASARMRSVRRQRRTVSLNKIRGRQKLNNEIIAFFRDAWDVFASRLSMFVLAMDMVLPPLNAEDCQENRSAGDLSDNSTQQYAARDSWKQRDSCGDQRWSNVAPRIFPVKDPSQSRVAQRSLHEVGQKNTKCRTHCTEPRNQPEKSQQTRRRR